jgi:hypothetical protein
MPFTFAVRVPAQVGSEASGDADGLRPVVEPVMSSSVVPLESR